MYSLYKLLVILLFSLFSTQLPASEPSQTIAKFLDKMIYVKGGNFNMGSDSSDSIKRESPAHQVELDDFFISSTEVTQGLFEEIMAWNVSYHACNDCPVNNVSWMNVQAFIKKLNNITGKQFRLPTEAQWEYAAKGGSKSKDYLFSGSNNIDDVAWYVGNANKKSHKVAQKKPNELGLYDMTGNMWEFCHDDMNSVYYQHSPKKNPLFLNSTDQTKMTMKVIRGGGYEFRANESQVFRRDAASSNVRLPDIGFRLVLNEVE